MHACMCVSLYVCVYVCIVGGLPAAVCHIGLLSVDGLLAAGSFGLLIAEGLPAAVCSDSLLLAV